MGILFTSFNIIFTTTMILTGLVYHCVNQNKNLKAAWSLFKPMENHAHDPIIVLKIEIRHDECSEILEKQLLRIDGVHQVAINREKEEVAIVGDVDPLRLLKYIAKLGKRAELLLYEKKPEIDQTNHAEKQHNHVQGSRDKHPYGGNQNAGETSKEKYYGCPDDHPYCKMNDSFHRYKYRPAAREFEKETSWEPYGQFHYVHKDDKYQAAAKEFEEEMCRDHHGQFHSFHNDNYHTAPGKTVEKDRDPYGHSHFVHNDKHHAAAKGAEEEEMCKDQQGQFHGRSRNTNGFVPPMNNEGAKYKSCSNYHPHCKMGDFTHDETYPATEEMNRGRYSGFYGRSRSTNEFMPPRDTEDAKNYPFPDDRPSRSTAKGVEEEMRQGGYDWFHGSNRNANHRYVPPRYNEGMCGNPKDHPHKMGDAFRETEIQEAIRQAKKEMDYFFNMKRRAEEHFASRSFRYHHDTPNPSQWTREEAVGDDYYHDRNVPPPIFRGNPVSDFEFREERPSFEHHQERMPSPHAYRGRPGTHYDKFTNLFSDENPSSCTII